MAAATAPSVQPVYVTARALPQYEALPTTYDLCVAAQAVSGRGTIRGAQRIRGLWRIYPKQKENRDKVLLEGFMFRGSHVSLLDQNPFTSRDQGEQPTTKLWISNIPLSVDNADIEVALKKIGVELISTLLNELVRNHDGRLTPFETGHRFVFVSIPKTPLLPMLKIGVFSANLYYKEANCENDIVCRGCLHPGHKKMDCPSAMHEQEARNTQPARGGEEGEGSNDTVEAVGACQPAVPHTEDKSSMVPQPKRARSQLYRSTQTRIRRRLRKLGTRQRRGAPNEKGEKRDRSESPQTEEQYTKRPTITAEDVEKEEREMEEEMGEET